jgi:uncharacterized membrane-anchored protein
MKTFLLLIGTIVCFFQSVNAQVLDSTQIKIDLIEKSLEYQTGKIELQSGLATLTVPEGFRYLDSKQAVFVLSDLWGNPRDTTQLGLLVPSNRGVLDPNGWVYILSYDEMGYVKDDDADDIDYDDLMKELQEETRAANPERIKEGYPPLEFIGWASPPYYDQDKKILHWAKEIKFGEDSVTTLNYNLRVLGRKGVFVMNAVASINGLQEVQPSIDNVVNSVMFADGSKYSDFDPGIDDVAAWTVGGLVAGKVLAKVGFFALILKFWKLIAVAVAGAGGAIWKWFKGKRDATTNV